MSDDLLSTLESFGASRSHLVDLREEGPRTLRYRDLARSPSTEQAPIVFEVQRQPRAYVFDARATAPDAPVGRWIRRIAFRGDAAWVGVLRPGRLDVYPAELDDRHGLAAATDLPQGPLLFPMLAHERKSFVERRVQRALLDLLRQSINQTINLGVAAQDALSLTGRALFWRFLIDRCLLDGVDPTEICPRASSFEACLSTKTNGLRTMRWLDDTFNGGLLPFSDPLVPRNLPDEVFASVVANIAHAATAEGQLQLRLPVEWREVNFAHVPVGLLSEVYEAFAHAHQPEQASSESVFYTPRHIAEFVVDEALASIEDVESPRVLDPAAGAGVFLVAAFRALVARSWARGGKPPSRKLVRRILNRQLAGFDVNDHALCLSELALYLTAIELDPERHPRPLTLLRFEPLRDRVLFRKNDPEGLGSLAPVEPQHRGQYDLVVGNPPWTASRAKDQRKQLWVAGTRELVAERLGEARAAVFDFPDANPDLPFVYRAMVWAKPKAAIALVTHARWLFGQTKSAVRARADLLESLNVTGLVNGTALRDSSVWPNVRHPFCLLFAKNERPPAHAALQFVSPYLDRTPDRCQHHMRIDWQDARDLSVAEIIERPWTFKARFRGTSFDESVFDDVQRRGVPLRDYLVSLATGLHNGYQVAKPGDQHPQCSAKHMRGMPDLKGSDPSFLVSTAELPKFSRTTLHRPRDPRIYRAPLLLVHESVRARPTTPRAILSLEDVVYDERFDGASFADSQDGLQVAEYLQLLLQSSITTHALLFLDSQFGVEREVVHKASIEAVRVVPWKKLGRRLRERAGALSRRLRDGMTDALLADIDSFVADIFDLSDVQRDAVRDTLDTGLPTAAAKARAARPTTSDDRQAFAITVERALRDLLGAKASVEVWNALDDGPWRFILVDTSGAQAHPQQVKIAPRAVVDAAEDAAVSLLTLRVGNKATLVGILDQYRYWTPTRARLLASSIVAET